MEATETLKIQCYEIHTKETTRLVVREEDENGMGREILSVSVYMLSWRRDPPAQVNWSAIGSVDADTARLYARMIARAADIANILGDPVTRWSLVGSRYPELETTGAVAVKVEAF